MTKHAQWTLPIRFTIFWKSRQTRGTSKNWKWVQYYTFWNETVYEDLYPHEQFELSSILANHAATADDETPLGNTNAYWKIQVIIDVVLQICKALEPEEHNSIKEVSYLRWNEPHLEAYFEKLMTIAAFLSVTDPIIKIS